jgi:hypothetical protein
MEALLGSRNNFNKVMANTSNALDLESLGKALRG